MSDPPVPTTASGETAAADLSSVAASAPEASPYRVEGDRLGVPYGSTKLIADYGRPSPSYVFLAVVALLTLVADVVTKGWAERHLDGMPGTSEVWKSHLTLLLAKNRGGAWGLLQSTSENVRRPFFLLVSVAAIAFIMTLYRRLQGHQRALKWGLPLVLGGALGNVFDRIRYGHVIDFIDAHTVYPGFLSRLLREPLGVDHHWPTFNVADIAICVGVGLMAIDMFTSKRILFFPVVRVTPAQSGEPVPGAPAETVAASPSASPPEPARAP